ncbi:MAG: hypothetical protein ACR2OO_07670, partial [Thermomicrobiales bacterium]
MTDSLKTGEQISRRTLLTRVGSVAIAVGTVSAVARVGRASADDSVPVAGAGDIGPPMAGEIGTGKTAATGADSTGVGVQ